MQSKWRELEIPFSLCIECERKIKISPDSVTLPVFELGLGRSCILCNVMSMLCSQSAHDLLHLFPCFAQWGFNYSILWSKLAIGS